MKAFLDNIEVRLNTDFANKDRGGTLTIAFTHSDYGDSLEWLDDGETLCADWNSNLIDEYWGEEYEEVREQLKAWLKKNATVSAATSGREDSFVLTVPADADNKSVVAVIEAENREIGGPDVDLVFDARNAVRVYRNGVEIEDLRQESTARDVLDDLEEAA